MTVQTYCSTDNLKSIMGEAGFVAALDDEENGVLSAQAELYATAAIERAAVKINAMVRHQYILADVASNDWLKWANAAYAVYELRCRKMNPAEASVDDNYQEAKDMLVEIRWGRQQLPEQSPSFDYLPTVSNLKVVPKANPGPVRVDLQESTGSAPAANSGRKRFTTGF